MKPTIDNATTGSYVDRADIADAEAMSARLADDAEKFQSFKTEAQAIQRHSVRAANIGREMGLSFQGYYLPPKRELAAGWFNAHYRQNLGMGVDAFNWFIGISRKLPAQVHTMREVMPALQLTLFAGELIELVGRAEAQVSHETTPYVFFFNSLRDLQSDLAKRLGEAPQWDEQTRTKIVAEIGRAETFLAEAKRTLMRET